MRRRSGGLHSDSSEEFMLLAEYSHERTGCYYDEALHTELRQKLRKKLHRAPSITERSSPNAFAGFDFAVHDEEAREEASQLWTASHTIEVNVVLISQQPSSLRKKLQQIWPESSHQGGEEGRALDLFVHTMRHQPQHIHCYKFWILEAGEADSPIYASYLKRARKVFRFGEGGDEWIPLGDAKGVLFECVSALAD